MDLRDESQYVHKMTKNCETCNVGEGGRYQGFHNWSAMGGTGHTWSVLKLRRTEEDKRAVSMFLRVTGSQHHKDLEERTSQPIVQLTFKIDLGQ